MLSSGGEAANTQVLETTETYEICTAEIFPKVQSEIEVVLSLD